MKATKFVVITIVILCFSSIVAAQTFTDIETYNDDDISEYSQGGDFEYDTVIGGVSGHALNINSTSTGDVTITSVGDGKDYPEPGENFSFYIQTDGTDADAKDAWVLFGVQSETTSLGPTEAYAINFDYDNDRLRVAEFNGGTTILSSTTGVGWSNYDNEIILTYVNWTQSGDINVTTKDYTFGGTVAQVNANDNTYTSGGIGIYWDNDVGLMDTTIDDWRVKTEATTTPTTTPTATPTATPEAADTPAGDGQSFTGVISPDNISTDLVILILGLLAVLTYLGVAFRSIMVIFMLVFSIIVLIFTFLTNISFITFWTVIIVAYLATGFAAVVYYMIR